MTSKMTPIPAEVRGALDEMAAVAPAGVAERYRAALSGDHDQNLTGEQQADVYQWGRRGLDAANVRLAGQVRLTKRTRETARPTRQH